LIGSGVEQGDTKVESARAAERLVEAVRMVPIVSTKRSDDSRRSEKDTIFLTRYPVNGIEQAGKRHSRSGETELARIR